MEIKKIAVRGGHTEKATGASALIDELTEDRKVKDAVIKYLRKLGYEVLDVTPPVNYTSSVSADLAYGVNKANEWGADLFISIHFNKAYDSYNGALGSEVCIYSENDIAQRVVNGLGELGFKNRGQKIRTNLYELKHTKMKAMIVETCFVEATEDVALYRKLGADAIGKAIAEAIVNKKLENKVINNNQVKEEMNYSMYIFSKNWYLKKYSDVAANATYKENPYKHYADYGKSEGRQPLPPIPAEYNEGAYLELNPDVAAAVKKGTYTSGLHHYLQYGFCESRKICKNDSIEAIKKRCEELEVKLEEIKKIVE